MSVISFTISVCLLGTEPDGQDSLSSRRLLCSTKPDNNHEQADDC